MTAKPKIKIPQQQRTIFAQRYKHALANIRIDEAGKYDWDNLWGQVQPLRAEIRKNTALLKCISEGEITIYFANKVVHFAKARGNTYLLKDEVSELELEKSAQSFADFLSGLPYNYIFYYSMPFELPDGIKEVRVTDKLALKKLRMPAPETAEQVVYRAFAAGLSGKKRVKKPPKIEKTFAIVRAQGYDDSAERDALAVLKQFFYLGISSAAFEYPTLTNYSPHCYCVREGNKDERGVTLPSSAASFISKISLHKEAFVTQPEPEAYTILSGIRSKAKISAQEFLRRNFLFSNLNSSQIPSDEKAYIEAAIHWGYEGQVNENETFGFIQTCIGLEALLGDDGETGIEKRGITEKLADRCAFLLAKTRAEREKINKEFQKIYKLRSKLVHGRKAQIEPAEEIIAFGAASYLRRLLRKEINGLSSQYKGRQ